MKSNRKIIKKNFLIVVVLAILASSAMAQEVCDNGIDDDNDGFIDCYDKDCAGNTSCANTYLGHDVNCQATPSRFPQFSLKQQWASKNKSADNMFRPSVGDLDRDGDQDVIVGNYFTSKISILDGKTGKTEKTVTLPVSINRDLAIANIDNDNCGEIFVTTSDFFVYAYDCNLNLLWKSQELDYSFVQIGIADFDGDGKVELYSRDGILDAHTGKVLIQPNTVFDVAMQAVAADVVGNDGKLELICGGIIYSVPDLSARNTSGYSLTEVKRIPEYQTRSYYSSTSVADYNLDGHLDIIATGSENIQDDNTTQFFWDVNNDVVKKYIDKIPGKQLAAGCMNVRSNFYEKGWIYGAGRINVADLDGDGGMNASYISGKYLYALDENWNLKWKVEINEETSGYTGCTVYDFNGDGAVEIVYRDEQYLYIINGTDGSINTQQRCISRTNMEYPIVVDIDGDGATELCIPCGSDDVQAWNNFCNFYYSENSQLRVYESASIPWVPARKVWNQHAYFNTNINDDLTVPKVQQKTDLIWSTNSCLTGNLTSRPLNVFLNQSPYLDTKGCLTYAAPNLQIVQSLFSITPPTCPESDFTVTLGIENIGDVPMNAQIPITFYKGDPTQAGALKLNTVTVNVNNLKKGDTPAVYPSLTVNGTGEKFRLYVVINDAGTSIPTPIQLPNTSFLECDYNNAISADVVPLTIPVTALKINDNIKCGATLPDNGAVQAYVVLRGINNTVDFDFLWYNNTVSGTPAYTGPIYTGLTAGTYKVVAQHKTAGCNSSEGSVQIIQKSISFTATVKVDAKNTNCAGPNGKLHAEVNGAIDDINYTYDWYEGNLALTTPIIATGYVANNLKGGTTYTVLVTDKNSGCQTVASLAVPDDSSMPVVTASSTNAICVPVNSGKVRANVGGNTVGYTFNWYKGTTTKPTADFTGAEYNLIPSGDYTVVSIDNTSGCKSAPVTVRVNLPPNFTVNAVETNPVTKCDPTQANGEAKASIVGISNVTGYNFKWFKGQNTASANAISGANTNIVTGLASGIYTVLTTDVATSCISSIEVTITQQLVYPVVRLTSTSNRICDNSKTSPPVQYSGSVAASITYNGIAVTNFSKYKLEWHNGASSSDPLRTETTSSISQLNTGSYTLVVTNTDFGCAAPPQTALVTNSITLPSITTNQTPSHNCTGGVADGIAEVTNVNGVAVSTSTNFTYQWYTGVNTTTSIPGSTNAKLSNLQGGANSNYTVLVTDKSSGCENTATILVNENKIIPVLTLTTSPNSVCTPRPAGVLFTGSVSKNSLTDTNAASTDTYTYAWSAGNTMGAIIAGQTGGALINQDGGYYTATVTNNRLGCTSSPVTIQILNQQVLPTIQITSVGSTNCSGTPNGEMTASVTNRTAGQTFAYQWVNNTNTNISNINKASNLQGGASNLYTVTVTNNQTGCVNSKASTLADIKSPPTLILRSTPNWVCEASKGYVGTALKHVLTDVNAASTDTYTYTWSIGSTMGAIVAGQTGSTLPNLEGGYYTATVTNNRLGCTSSPASIQVLNDGVLPNIQITAVASSNCSGTPNGEMSVTVTNASPAETFTYEWVNSANTVISNNDKATNLQGGTSDVFTVTVTNNRTGCAYSDSGTLSDIKSFPSLTLKSTPNSVCDVAKGFTGKAMRDVLTDINAASTDTYTYAWSTGNTMGAIITGQTGNTLSDKEGGFYTATVTNNRLGCTSNPATIQILNNQVLPAIQITKMPSTSCTVAAANGEMTANVTNASVGETFTFQWYEGTAAVAGMKVPDVPNTGNTNKAIKLQGGLNYTVKAYNNVTGCENTNSQTLTDNKQLPSLSLTSQPNTICNSATAISGKYDGQIVATVNAVGNYLGSVSGDFTFTWSTGLTGTGINTLLEQTAGTYTVTATHTATQCASTPYNAQITSAQVLPSITMGQIPATNCTPTGVLDGTAQVLSILPTGKNYTYKWYDGNSVLGTPQRTTANTTATNDNYQHIKGGMNGVSLFQYTVEVTILQTGCVSAATIGVEQDSQLPQLAPLVTTDNKLCVGGNGTATVSTLTYRGNTVPVADFGQYTFTWAGTGTQSPVQTYTGLTAGNYTLTVTKNSSQCTSNPVSVTVNNSPYIPIIDVVKVDQTSCDVTTPNGSVTATIDETSIGRASGVTTGYTFSWKNDVTNATIASNTYTNLKGNQNYTIRAVNQVSQCETTRTHFLKETLVTPTITIAVTDFTNCTTPNGALAASVLPTTGTYSYYWYNGNNAIDADAVIAGANYTGGATYSSLLPAEYTLVVQNTSTKCKSTQVISTVPNRSPRINPVVQNTLLPADCNVSGGKMDGGVQTISMDFTATNGSPIITTTGPLNLPVNTLVIIGRKGALTLPTGLLANNVYFIKTIAGNSITLSSTVGGTEIILGSNGDGVIGDFATTGYTYEWFSGVPSPTNAALGSINYFTNPPVYSGTALSTTSSILNLRTGLFTLEVTDPTTGCKNYLPHTLPYVGAHTVINVTKTNSTICSPTYATGNGSVEIQIENPTGNMTLNQRDYRITLKQGTNVVVAPFDGPNNSLPFPVSTNNLAPNSYVIEVAEKFTGSNCIISKDVIIGADALPPIVSLVGTINSNTACLLTSADGRISINVDKDPLDLTTGTTYTILMTPNPNATFPLNAVAPGNYTANNLSPDTYTFTATASTGCSDSKTYTVLDNPTQAEIKTADISLFDAEACDPNVEVNAKAIVNRINLVGGGVENINDYQFDWYTDQTLTTNILSAIGNNSATKGGEELSNVSAPLPTRKITDAPYWVTAIKVTDVSNTGGIGCVTNAYQLIIDPKKVNPTITLTNTGDSSCDPTVFQGAINVNVTTASGPGAGGVYDYVWSPNAAPGQPVNSNGNSGNNNNMLNINEGNYTLTASNTTTGCSSTSSTTLLKIAPPVFTLNVTATDLTNCAVFDGNIEATNVFENGVAGILSNYDFVWYKSNLTNVVLDGQNAAIVVDDKLNNTTYTAISTDQYFVKAVRKAGGPGIGCESTAINVHILDKRVYPQLTYSSLPNDACTTNWDGAITINATTNGFGAGTLYGISFTAPTVANVLINNPADQASVAPVLPSTLSYASYTTSPTADRIASGNYQVQIENRSNGCSTTGTVAVSQNVIPINLATTSSDITHCITPNGMVDVTGVTLGSTAAPITDFSYTWTGLGGPYTSQGINNLSPGTYVVTATKTSAATNRTSFGCVSAPASEILTDVHINPQLTASSTANDACTVNWNGAITVKATTQGFGAGTLYSYAFTPPAVLNVQISNPANQASVAPVAPSTYSVASYSTPNTDFIAAGDYQVYVENMTNGCSSDATITVTQNTVPIKITAVSSPVTVCTSPANGTANVNNIRVGTFNATPTAADFTFSWTGPAGPYLGQSLTNLNLGSYTVVATKTSAATSRTAFGCSSNPETIEIEDSRVYPQITFTSTPNDACTGPFWNGSITVHAGTTGFGAGTLYDYVFTPPAVVNASINNTTSRNLASTAPVPPATVSLASYTTQNTDQVAAGDYNVQVTNQSNGCTADASITVTQNNYPIVLTGTVLPRTHCTNLNGSMRVSNNGITIGGSNAGVVLADFTFAWSGVGGPYAAGAVQSSNLDKGSHTVIATKNSAATNRKAFGCPSDPLTLQVPDEIVNPIITFSVVANSACDTNYDGSITVSAVTNSSDPTIANSNYNFNWVSIPAAPVQINTMNNPNLPSPYTTTSTDRIGRGIYTIEVTNTTNACRTSSAIGLFDNLGKVSITATTKQDQNTCNPGGSIQVRSVAVNGVDDPVHTNFVFDWYKTSITNPAILTGTGIDQLNATNYNTISAGTYYVTAKKAPGVSKASGCVSAPIRVDINDIHTNPVIARQVVNNNTSCVGGTSAGRIEIQEPAPMNFTYQWFVGNNASGTALPGVNLTGVNHEIAQNLMSGNYTVKVTDNNTNCFTAKTILIENIPTIVKIDPTGFTKGNAVNCDILTGSPMAGTASITNILEQVGTTITNGNLNNYNYTWINSSNVIIPNGTSPFTQRALGVGQYIVKVTGNSSNCETQYGFKIEDKTNESTKLRLSSFENPEQCVVDKSGFLEVEGINTTSTYSYEWYLGDQRPAPMGTPMSTSNRNTITLAQALANQNYTVKAINNTTHCWGVEMYNLPVLTNPIYISASSSPIFSCSIDNGEVIATVINDLKTDYNFYWSRGSVLKTTPDYTGDVVKNLSIGQYTVQAIDKLNNVCKSLPLTVTIGKKQIPPVVTVKVLKDLTMCDLTKANGVAIADVMGDLIHYTFEWYKGTSVSGSIIGRGPQVGKLEAKDYTVEATNKVTNCKSTATVKINENFEVTPPPTVTVLYDLTSCITSNGELGASVKENTRDYIFEWAKGNNAPPPVDFTGEYFRQLSEGDYTVRAISRITGCISEPTIGTIRTDQEFPDFGFSIKNASCKLANGIINLEIKNKVSLERITWYDADGTFINNGPILSNAMTALYKVTARTLLGCETSKEILLPVDILAYNGISKKDKGKLDSPSEKYNSKFYVDCLEKFPNNRVEIFNRAGTKVYEGNGYDNTTVFFEGTSNQGINIMGTDLPSGTYFYVITKGDNSERVAGYLELIN